MTWAIGLQFAVLDPCPHHEGLILHPALMVNHGLEPVRDVFFPHPPTTAYAYALLFRIFGEKLLVARLATMTGLATVVTLFALHASRFLPVAVASALAVSWALTSQLLWDQASRPWPTLWGLLFLQLAVWSLLRWVDAVPGAGSRTEPRGPASPGPMPRAGARLLLAGAALGVVATFRMNLGLYAGVTLSAAVAWIAADAHRAPGGRARVRAVIATLLALTVPAALVVSSVLAAFVWRWGSPRPLHILFTFQRSLPVLQARLYGAAWSLRPNLGLDGEGLFRAVLYGIGPVWLFPLAIADRTPRWARPFAALGALAALLPLQGSSQWEAPLLKMGPAILGVAAWDLWKRRRAPLSASARGALLSVASAAAAWGLMFPGGDTRYLAWAGFPLLMLVIERLRGHLATAAPPRAQRLGTVLAVGIALLLQSTWHVRDLFVAVTGERMEIRDGLYAGMRPRRWNGVQYLALRTYVQSHSAPDEPVLIWKADLLHYTWLGRRSPIPSTPTLDNLIYLSPLGQDLESSLLAQLQATPPKLVVVDPSRQRSRSWDIPVEQYDDSFPRLKAYLDAHYAFAWASPNRDYVVLARTAAP